jgi:hypothetical protein
MRRRRTTSSCRLFDDADLGVRGWSGWLGQRHDLGNPAASALLGCGRVLSPRAQL